VAGRQGGGREIIIDKREIVRESATVKQNKTYLKNDK
jgi:hypothetical protein